MAPGNPVHLGVLVPFLLSLAAASPLALPLENTRVDVLITGPYAELTVEQTFTNPNEEFIEAIYSFPLHQEAAVDEMWMRVGDRVIEGRIHERAEARELYEQAKDEGRTAALTDQERPNLFTQSVANLAPGETVSVTLHMIQPLTYEDGVYRFEMPLTVGPRFIPAGVEDAEAISRPVSSGPTGATVDIHVTAELGSELEEVWSPSHELRPKVSGGHAVTSLTSAVGDRDFVLNMDLAGEEPVASLLVQDSHFALTLEPQPLPTEDQVVPRELIFVVDNSCSMNGVPLDMAKDAMRKALENLHPKDSFQVIRFSEEASALGATPLLATPENIERGIAYVNGMEGMGGTHMMAGIEASLDYPYDPERKRIVAFMTDGYIGNETQILGAIEDKLGSTRLFSFGIGSSVNRYLLDQMAEVGRGDVTYVLLEEDPAGKVDAFYDRIAQPVLTDIEIEVGGEVMDVYPERIPDLFVGHPVRITGRFVGELGPVTLRGRAGGEVIEQTLHLTPVDDGSAIGSAWARQRIKALEREQLHGEIPEVKEEITLTAIDYGLLTRYTSFLAVDYRIRNPGGDGDTVEQPNEGPAGVDLNASIGTDVSRIYTPPGDPLLTVDAPETADSVIAFFPWGEVAEMRWDESRHQWFHRFLVPRGVEDGEIFIRVVVTHPDGTIEVREQHMVVDSQAPEIVASVEAARGMTTVEVFPEEPLRTIEVFPVGRPDLRVELDVRDAQDHSFTLVLPGTWDEVVIVAKDLAFNRIQTTAYGTTN